MLRLVVRAELAHESMKEVRRMLDFMTTVQADTWTALSGAVGGPRGLMVAAMMVAATMLPAAGRFALVLGILAFSTLAATSVDPDRSARVMAVVAQLTVALEACRLWGARRPSP